MFLLTRQRLALPSVRIAHRVYSTDINKLYSETLSLPKTAYNIGSPSDKESSQLVEKTGEELYRWQSENLPKNSTIQFHDGPPYANGSLHMGHAMNKVVKDMINRYHVKKGQRVQYTPGWDCHGLPIENATIAKVSKKKKIKVSQLTMERRRELCAEMANSMAQLQLEGFKNFGVMADWTNDIYKTLTNDYVLRQLNVFKHMMNRGLISRKNRPVFWSVESQTALAEGELEYGEKASTAVLVKYKLEEPSLKGFSDLFLVIWTTTPWTLPSNQAIAVHEQIEYGIVESDVHGKVIVAVDQAHKVTNHDGSPGKLLDTRIQGSELVGLKYSCLMKGSDDLFPILAGNHVTATSGTGLVHSAPGHGMEDYLMCTAHGMEPYSPVNDKGQYTSDVHNAFNHLIGLDARKNQDQILELGESRGAIMSIDRDYRHNVPFDWRSKTPVMVRSTPQFFADISGIKERALKSLDNVEFTPPSGVTRLKAFTKSRTEWCISRQRVWGVPIPALFHKTTGELLMNDESVSHIINVVERKGINAWFQEEEDVSEWLPKSRESEGLNFRKGFETMDVWFDSGTSWTMLPGEKVADYYLEGSDQHRGWFQSSLLTKIATEDSTQAPFKRVITHGFVMDKDGRKMSKSLGNVILPDAVKQAPQHAKQKEKLGIDGLRLWIASTDYTVDASLSMEVLSQLASLLKKFRVTFKFLLGNLKHYDGSSVEYKELYPTDRLALHDLTILERQCRESYDSLNFSKVVQLLSNHMSGNLSAFYFDIVKDRLYCDGTFSESRKSVQYVFSQILNTYIDILSPITPLTVQQVWNHMPEFITLGMDSPFKKQWTQLSGEWEDPQLKAEIDLISNVRDLVNDAMDKGRVMKHVRSPLSTEVHLQIKNKDLQEVLEAHWDHLPAIFITSKVYMNERMPKDVEWSYMAEDQGGNKVVVAPPTMNKCPRCWQFTALDENSLCGRCEATVAEM